MMPRVSNFTVLFTMVIVMLIGAALIFRVDISADPRPRQGKTITVEYSWPGASAKVVEQNVTSLIEGLVSSVRGVEKVESESKFGKGWVCVTMKSDADVTAARFEIASLIKQIHKKLPPNVTYPNVRGGDIVGNVANDVLLLTYQIHNQSSLQQLRAYVDSHLEPELKRLDGVKRVEVVGGTDRYIEITYDPLEIKNYGLTAGDIEEGVKAFIGENKIVGNVTHHDARGSKKRMSAMLVTEPFSRPLEEMPLKEVGGKVIYLNDLAEYEYKYRTPESYFRINGLSTVYFNVYVDSHSNLFLLSSRLRGKIGEMAGDFKGKFDMELSFDGAEKQQGELYKLVTRSLLSLLILLLLTLGMSRSWRYMAIVAVTLAAAVFMSVIAYWLFDIRLHIFSLAGITVSFGLIIDASIVMIDHYGYHRDRTAFLSILAALLTTIGALALIFFLPESLRQDLYDFAWVVIINLTAALLVALLFVPALVDAFGYTARNAAGSVRRHRMLIRLTRLYQRYIVFTQKRKWVYIVVFILLFGIPIFALPDRWSDKREYLAKSDSEKRWYELAYDKTLGNNYYATKVKPKLSKWLGGTMRLFAESIETNSRPPSDEVMKLNIRAKMPQGGTAAELNEKVVILEDFLKTCEGISRWETRINSSGANIVVEFTPEVLGTGYPFVLEGRVIGKVIGIGGADWATWGVSERGFSNSLNLQYRSQSIDLTGYNYDHLYRLAERMCDSLSLNRRCMDIAIQTPRYENQEDEYFVRYDHQRMALAGVSPIAMHKSIASILSATEVGEYNDGATKAAVTLQSGKSNTFDFWQLTNSQIRVDSVDMHLGNYITIDTREAKNVIQKRNQQYVLKVAFNIVGSYEYGKKYLEKFVRDANDRMPIGYKCAITTYGWREDSSEQYWLLGLIIIIIYFLCGILFESLRLPFAIISLIPISFIGVFVVFWLTATPFGSGGFAGMVLLCGITVNSGIYIINEYQRIVKGSQPAKTYVRAYNHKIVAVALTVASTILGLIPFLLDGYKGNEFWYSFALGSIAGLAASVFALVFAMPILLPLRPKSHHFK